MAAAFHFRLVFLILSLVCDIVESRKNSFRNLALRTMRQETEPYSRSEEFQEDVISVVSTLIVSSHLQLKFLYDKDYADAVDKIASHSQNSSGLFVDDYSNSKVQLSQILVPSSGSTLLLALCSPANILKIFRQIFTDRLDSHFVDWLLVFENKGSETEVIKSLEGLIYEGTLVTLMLKDSVGKFDIFTSRVTTDGIVRFFKRGRIDLNVPEERDQLPELLGRNDHQIYSNMEGRFLRVSVVYNYGLCTLGRELPDGSVEALSGTDIAMVRVLSQNLNFTFQTVYPPDKAYGNPLPNGTVTGMVGMAARREVAFSTCSIAVSNLRETAVDFAYPYVRGSLGIFSRAPKQKNRALAVLSPFSLEVWLSLVASILAMGLLVTVHSLTSKSYLKDQNTKNEGIQWITFNMFRSFVVQGNRIQPKLWSQRFVLFTWFVFCLVISALYSGMLTAVLAIPEFETPVNSLTDFPRVVEEGFTIGILKDSANEYLFREATGGIYKDTWGLFNHKDRSESFVDSNTAGMERVASRNYVYIGFKLVCEIVATRLGRSKIHVARETLFDHSLSVALPPGAPYQQIFSKKLMMMVEGGLLDKWKEDELDKMARGVSREGEKKKTYAITLTHLQAAFFVIILGSILSTLILFTEQLVSSL